MKANVKQVFKHSIKPLYSVCDVTLFSPLFQVWYIRRSAGVWLRKESVRVQCPWSHRDRGNGRRCVAQGQVGFERRCFPRSRFDSYASFIRFDNLVCHFFCNANKHSFVSWKHLKILQFAFSVRFELCHHSCPPGGNIDFDKFEAAVFQLLLQNR